MITAPVYWAEMRRLRESDGPVSRRAEAVRSPLGAYHGSRVELFAHSRIGRATRKTAEGVANVAIMLRIRWDMKDGVEACEKITCRCFGNPDEESKGILAGFGATYEETARAAFVLNPKADKDSLV